MNEDSGTAYDSTAHGLDALPSCGVNGDVSQMVAYENGACGRARVNGVAELEAGNFMMVPSYDALGLRDCFVVSGWFNTRSVESYPKLIVRSDLWTDGWGIEVDKNNPRRINVVGGVRESHLSASLASDLTMGWLSLTFCYEGDAVSVYENGVCLTNNVAIGAATENGRPLAFGNRPNGLNRSLSGQYDEIRLRGGTLSADRIKADYDMIANRDFCTYGKVEGGAGK